MAKPPHKTEGDARDSVGVPERRWVIGNILTDSDENTQQSNTEYTRPTLVMSNAVLRYRLDNEDKYYPLSRLNSCTIGRDNTNSISLVDRLVSRDHAFVRCTASGSCELTDLGSSNGTRVNGKIIEGVILLKDGDTIQIGQQTIEFIQSVRSRLERTDEEPNPNLDLISNFMKLHNNLRDALLDSEYLHLPKPPPAENPSQSEATEDARLNLLDEAANTANQAIDPYQAFEDETRAEAVALLGGDAVLGRTIRTDQELLEALIQGFPSDVLRALREAGLPHAMFEQIVAPRRTLMRRKAEGQRLTRSESDAVWRLAIAYALGARVLNGRKAAVDWLSRPKSTFANQTPVDLLETSVGAAHVYQMLRRLEWGDVA